MTVLDHDSHADHDADPGASPSHARGWLGFTVTCLGLLMGLFVFGFAVFTAIVMREPAPQLSAADGIIVLTGGDYRIVEGARLLSDGRANRLLISGVNEKATRDDLLKLSGLTVAKFDCCVELGYAAQDTVGNAEEARAWATGRHLTRLIVVTSSYHMPRSLAELALAMPDAELIPHAVVPRKFRDGAWWVHPIAARLLLSEYVKFLPVAARLETMRLLRPSSAPTANADRPAPAQS